MLNDLYTPDIAAEGFSVICGIDEAGRGPLAGPVCAAAVVMDAQTRIDGLNDSKKLSEKRREALFDVITENALSIGVGLVSCDEIDRINILNATMEAMRLAAGKLKTLPDIYLIDGDRTPGSLTRRPVRPVIGGDALVTAIAAASVIAKVTRDRIMREADKLYPGYGFARHKGYGTAAHYAAIREYGLCPVHRRSFTKGYE